MAADPPFLPGIVHDLAVLPPAVLIYLGLIAIVALTGVFTSKPARRRAALDVLHLLLPGRSRDQAQDNNATPPPGSRRPPHSSGSTASVEPVNLRASPCTGSRERVRFGRVEVA